MTTLYEAVCSETHNKSVYVHNLVWDCERHTMQIGKVTVLLTATEYRLLFPLRHGRPVTYAELARLAYNYAVDDKVRTMMDKHIDRIRGKLRGTGIYVYCVLSYGYLLLPELIPDDDFRKHPSKIPPFLQ